MRMMAENTGKKRQKYSKLRKQEAIAGWIFVLPAVAFWLIWFLYPAVKAISISFYHYNYATPETNAFIGLDNYKRMLTDPDLRVSILNSLKMMALTIIFQVGIAFVLAVLVSNVKKCNSSLEQYIFSQWLFQLLQ